LYNKLQDQRNKPAIDQVIFRNKLLRYFWKIAVLVKVLFSRILCIARCIIRY